VQIYEKLRIKNEIVKKLDGAAPMTIFGTAQCKSMKYSSFLFIVTLFCAACANQPVKDEAEAGKDSLPALPDTLTRNDMSPRQRVAWDSIYNMAVNPPKYSCVEIYDIKIGCREGECEGIYLESVIDIDPFGKVKDIAVLYIGGCELPADTKESIKNCYLSNFCRLAFPASLRGVKVKERIGNILKC
jgi:hypothetical protein